MVDTGAVSDTATPRRPVRKVRGGGGNDHDRDDRSQRNPPQIDIQGAASPIVERPQDYVNADAVYSTGEGAVSGYHYERQGTYRDQLATSEMAQVKGPGQA